MSDEYYEAIIAREFVKASGREVARVVFDEDEVIVVQLRDGAVFLQEIGSDDDEFHFEDGDGNVVAFPIPDDYLENNND